MSHFTVLVVGDDVEGQLAPYDENTEVEPYRCYEEGGAENYWAVDMLRTEKYLPEGPVTWQQVIDAMNAKCGDEGEVDLIVDEDDPGRAYRMSTYNQLAKWDWYSIGGRWTGFFKIKPDARMAVALQASGAPQLGRPGVFDNPPKHDADVVRAGDIDWDGMRADAERDANDDYDAFEAAVTGQPVPHAWAFVRESMFPDDINAARGYYDALPFVRALRTRQLDPMFDEVRDFYCLDDIEPGVEYRPGMGNRAKYVGRHTAAVGIPYAVVKDGEWIGRGRMGWFGMSSDEVDKNEWNSKVQTMLRELPPDTRLTLTDCHI